jgi:hypothetical protein
MRRNQPPGTKQGTQFSQIRQAFSYHSAPHRKLCAGEGSGRGALRAPPQRDVCTLELALGSGRARDCHAYGRGTRYGPAGHVWAAFQLLLGVSGSRIRPGLTPGSSTARGGRGGGQRRQQERGRDLTNWRARNHSSRHVRTAV